MKVLGLVSFLFLYNIHSEIITTGNDSLEAYQEEYSSWTFALKSFAGNSVVEMSEAEQENLAEVNHHHFNRCGGYFVHDSVEDALSFLREQKYHEGRTSFLPMFVDGDIRIIRDGIDRVEEERVLEMIEKLSSFKNRYYKSETGVQAAKLIKNTWEKLVEHRKDADVRFFDHARWAQPSVMLQIKGSESTEEIIVGGHLDSINQWSSKAPGADDNASGIATITEIIRVLMELNYEPKKTLTFFGYAAEEVGLRGSNEIATRYARDNKKVKGVMQLDMTNFHGSEKDIWLVADHTDKNQNSMLGELIENYLPEISWGYTRCGYACSDHASWTAKGFVASFPFEADKNDMNRNIHTTRDTLATSNNSAEHASKFAKLGISFVIEHDLGQ